MKQVQGVKWYVKFRKLSGMLVRKQGLSLKQVGKIYVCYVRPVLLYCCATLELTVANEVTLHRVEHCIYYICIYHILSYTEYVNDIKSVSCGI